MKRKIFLILGILLAVWLCMFAIDFVCAASLHAPIFVFPGITADDGGSGTYYGLGYTVEVEKYLDADYGISVRSVEMRILGHVIAASIT